MKADAAIRNVNMPIQLADLDCAQRIETPGFGLGHDKTFRFVPIKKVS